MQKDEKQAQCSTIKVTAGRLEIGIFQERVQELEQREQEFMESRPSLENVEWIK